MHIYSGLAMQDVLSSFHLLCEGGETLQILNRYFATKLGQVPFNTLWGKVQSQLQNHWHHSREQIKMTTVKVNTTFIYSYILIDGQFGGNNVHFLKNKLNYSDHNFLKQIKILVYVGQNFGGRGTGPPPHYYII